MLYWLDGEYQGQTYAYLYAVATCREFQGRGICRALMEDTLSFLAGNRYAGAVLYPASEGLRAMYEKMGFRNWGRGETFPCAAGEKIPVRRIAAEEYADLRRRYLPEDGLLQEGASLALLEKTTGLYAGDGFLLAANREGETLNAQELLGDRSAATGILAALGCGKGTFRRGAAVMGRILKADAPTPGYVGLVFD